jgi:AcrR family transcriptional regulator
MSSNADNGSNSRSRAGMSRSAAAAPGAPRRHDAQATRRALLDAASALFDERGYDGATVRDIGERAGVDPALIARYFGAKEGLYLAALEHGERPPLPAEPVAALAAMLGDSEARGQGPIPHAMVSTTLSDDVRERVTAILSRRVVEPLAAHLSEQGAADAQLRAELLLALAAGISLTRAGGTLPALAAASLDRILGVVTPAAVELTRARK